MTEAITPLPHVPPPKRGSGCCMLPYLPPYDLNSPTTKGELVYTMETASKYGTRCMFDGVAHTLRGSSYVGDDHVHRASQLALAARQVIEQLYAENAHGDGLRLREGYESEAIPELLKTAGDNYKAVILFAQYAGISDEALAEHTPFTAAALSNFHWLSATRPASYSNPSLEIWKEGSMDVVPQSFQRVQPRPAVRPEPPPLELDGDEPAHPEVKLPPLPELPLPDAEGRYSQAQVEALMARVQRDTLRYAGQTIDVLALTVKTLRESFF